MYIISYVPFKDKLLVRCGNFLLMDSSFLQELFLSPQHKLHIPLNFVFVDLMFQFPEAYT